MSPYTPLSGTQSAEEDQIAHVVGEAKPTTTHQESAVAASSFHMVKRVRDSALKYLLNASPTDHLRARLKELPVFVCGMKNAALDTTLGQGSRSGQ